MVRFYLLDLKQMRNRQSFYTKPVDIKTSLAKNFATSQLRNNSVFKRNHSIYDARKIFSCVFFISLDDFSVRRFKTRFIRHK